jgi:hypothetical protein
VSVLLALAVIASGLHGVVTRGPITPVCKVGVPCNAPAAGAVLAFARPGRAPVKVRCGKDGRYAVRLEPGYYTVTVAPTPPVGFGIRPRRVHVARGVDARLDFSIDTGIR